ncbi:HAD family hydrolase [Paeniglutamicibacter cryotolerans]|uniref:HAD family hydrolase n=1 Tax=Paeniglutamicibacter cryotolerans TaxID=670079 RepID=UPI0028A79914|nr:HAD family hydrolase [Paeniglutamicibacter cryotolerans]
MDDALRALTAAGNKDGLANGYSRAVVDPRLSGRGRGVGDGQILDAVVASDEVAAGRPAPHVIHRLMELTGVCDVRRVLAAGDTVNDLAAARNAGVVAAGVRTGELHRADIDVHPHIHVLGGVRDIPGLLKIS